MRSINKINEAVTPLVNKVFEAAKKKPSGIVKSSTQLRKVMNDYITGDIYDLHSPTIEQEDTYADTSANGFILDKSGNIYTVSAHTNQGDAGRIAGGSTDYHVTIHKVDGEHDVKLSGYQAVFSTPHGNHIIDDIRDGYTLEDYLAKNEFCIDSGKDYVKDLIAAGNKDAKSFATDKEEAKKNKAEEFATRYVKFPGISWKFKDNEVKLYNNYVIDKCEPVKTLIIDKIISILNKEFGNLNGISIGGGVVFVTDGHGSNDYIAVDTKKNNLVWIKAEFKNWNYKFSVSSDAVEFGIGSTLKAFYDDSDENGKELLVKAYDKWKKEQKHEHKAWVDRQAEKIWSDGRGMYPWNPDKYTKKAARELAEDQWKEIIDKNNPASAYYRRTQTPSFPIELLKEVFPKMKTDVTVELPEPDTSINKAKEPKNDVMPVAPKEVKLSKKAQEEAEGKMDAWHNGTRKQNIGAMSDAKLKMNLQICKDKKYDKEVEILQKEAEKRGLTL